jgi:polar amino acid transport system ATP-binding protein
MTTAQQTSSLRSGSPAASHASAAPSNAIVSVRNVKKAFGEHQVLRGVSLDVPKGTAAALIGPSGSGKSTLLRCINGLVAIDGGEVHAAGHAVHALRDDKERIALRKDVSMVFQQYNLFPHMTVLENVMLAPIQVLKQRKDEVEQRAIELLAKVRLSGKEKAHPGQLSGGQQQRVAIARSLAMRPDVMLFDEVTAALDPETVKEVLNTIRELVDEGMTSILVTHEMRFAREIAHQVFFTDKGLIVESGRPKEFFDSPQDARTREFLSHVL